jgi:ABC-type uncharacterized transport system auxiliary subunit
MSRTALLTLAAVALAGCASAPVHLPETVYIPVAAECPVPDIPARPRWPVLDLPPTATDAQKALAIVQSLRYERAYSDALLQLLAPQVPK